MKNVHMCYMSDRRKIENFKKERKMRIRLLIFIYSIYFAYLKVYTKFHNPKSSSVEKTLTKNFNMFYIGVTKGKIEKEGKVKFSIFIFI